MFEIEIGVARVRERLRSWEWSCDIAQLLCGLNSISTVFLVRHQGPLPIHAPPEKYS